MSAAANYVGTMTFLLVGFTFYTGSPHFKAYFSVTHDWAVLGLKFSTVHVFAGLVVAYAVALMPYYLLTDERSSALVLVKGLAARQFDEAWNLAARTMAVKAFFAPLMILWLLSHIGALLNEGSVLVRGTPGVSTFLELPFFKFAISVILMADVLMFTLGYLVEAEAFGNRIRSVETTALGWVVCLLCYPPFSGATEAFLGWSTSEHPEVPGAQTLNVVLNVAVLVLMATYAWASLALGLKASNLTSRGVVSSGPYAFVRHPAYAAKNTAWLLGAVPAFWSASGVGEWTLVLLSVTGWAGIYILRALTEERHLAASDPDYGPYMRRVRYRFIPGVV